MLRAAVAVGREPTLGLGLGRGYAVAAAADRGVDAERAITIGITEGAALGIYALLAGAAVGIELALGHATLVGATDIGHADVILLGRLAVCILGAAEMADAVDASLAGATLGIVLTAGHIGGLGNASIVATRPSSATACIVRTAALAEPVDAQAIAAAFAVKYTWIGWEGDGFTDGIIAFVARSAVGLHTAGLGLRRLVAAVRLTRMARDVANEPAGAVGGAIAEACLRAGFVRGTETPGSALA